MSAPPSTAPTSSATGNAELATVAASVIDEIQRVGGNSKVARVVKAIAFLAAAAALQVYAPFDGWSIVVTGALTVAAAAEIHG